jgi:hypothetical protein
MLQNRSRPIVSEDTDDEDDEAQPVIATKGKTPEWQKMDEAYCQVFVDFVLKEAITPIRKMRRGLREVGDRVAQLEQIHTANHERVDVVSAALRVRIKDLEQLVSQHEKEIETVTAFPFRYCGVFKQGKSYRMNESVTFRGALWIALISTETKPGESRHWQLAVKAGRDAKDVTKGNACESRVITGVGEGVLSLTGKHRGKDALR